MSGIRNEHNWKCVLCSRMPLESLPLLRMSSSQSSGIARVFGDDDQHPRVCIWKMHMRVYSTSSASTSTSTIIISSASTSTSITSATRTTSTTSATSATGATRTTRTTRTTSTTTSYYDYYRALTSNSSNSMAKSSKTYTPLISNSSDEDIRHLSIIRRRFFLRTMVYPLSTCAELHRFFINESSVAHRQPKL
jgi:hypothetical protein